MRKLNFLKTMLLAVVMMVGSVAWGQTFLINESFENTTFPPNGWTNSTSGAIRSTNNPRTGDASLAFNGVNDAIFTPMLINPKQLSFWYRRSSNSTAWTLEIEISADASSWTKIGQINDATTTYEEATFDLSSYSNIYVRLIDKRTSGTHERYVDDFTVSMKESQPSTATPTFTPTGGTYTSAQNVELSSTTAGAKIYYTTNGDEPTSASSLYTGAIPVSTTTTIKAIAYDADDDNPSAVVSAEYIINIPDPNNPYNLDDSNPVNSLNETFEAGNIPATWTNVAVQGDKTWTHTTYQNNSYAQMSAFEGTGVYQTLLISPAINFDEISKSDVSFDLKVGYANGASLKVYVMKKDGTKTEVKSITSTTPTNGYEADFTTHSLDLSDYSGVQFLVFEYNGDVTNNQTTTYQIDNVVVYDNTPTILVDKETLTFSAYVHETSPAQTVTLTVANLTTAPIYEITGDNSSEFAASGTLTVDGGEISVTFSPTSEGEKTATLTITSGTVSQTVSLSGTGRLPKEPSVVISQIYGGGGNSGAIYNADFVELFNLSDNDVALEGWSLQYASATGAFSNRMTFETGSTIKAGHYFLVKLAGGANGSALPTLEDATGSLSLAASNGKIALANNNSQINNLSDANVIDYVGFGTANAYEGSSAAPAPSVTTAIYRIDFGATDTDDNGNDFETGDPRPRNSDYYLASEDNAFRSQDSGDWSSTDTWEGSYDEGDNWYKIGNDIIPSQMAASISIQPDHLVTINSEATASTLIIQPKGMLTVGEGTLETGNLQILSDATGTGTILNYGGEAEVQQYLASRRNWYMSVPVNAMTTAPTGFGYWYYDELTGAAAWPTTTSLVAGKGYLVYPNEGFTDGAITFNGILNSEDINVEITRSSSNTTKPGYNLVGNPYPSYLDVSNLKNNTAIEPSLWYRTKTGSGNYVFDLLNLESGLATNPSGLAVTYEVPPMQAFWLRVAETETSATVNFIESNRKHGSEPDVVKPPFRAPSAGQSEQSVLRLRVSNGIDADEAIIYFNGNALSGYDRYDSYKMSNANVAIPEIYTLLNNKQVAINGMNAIPYDIPIALGFVTGTAGNFTITANEVQNFADNAVIILKDNVTGIETDLTKTPSYTFSSEALRTSERFSVIFPKSDVPTSVSEKDISKFLTYTKEDQIIIQIDESLLGADIFVYNNVGQLIVTQKANSLENAINKSLLPGVYFVKIKNQAVKTVIR